MNRLATILDRLRQASAQACPGRSLGEPVESTFRARQLQAVLRLTPLTMLANGLNVALMLWIFWPSASRPLLLAWAAGIAWAMHQGLKVWRRWRQQPDGWQHASAQAMRRATVHAAVLAALWGAAAVALFPGADDAQRLLLATIVTGMICAGGFALATTPVAGTAYVLVLGSSAAAALFLGRFPLALPISALLTIYSLIVMASIWSTARLFGGRLVAEAEAARQNELIGLLLRDFEENASDVLWETDAGGRLCHVSPRVLRLFRMPVARLQSRPVIEWLRQLLPPDDEQAAAQWQTLQQHLERDQPFRDLPLATARQGQARWWLVSGRPLLDATGRRTGWRGVCTDVTEAQLANQQLSWLAHYDALTGLVNRHHFRDRLAERLESPAGELRPFAVLCLDLDHFKTINDTLGHAVGDGLLEEVGRRLRSRTRRVDTVARLGGDEFAVLLHETLSVGEVALLTQRLLEGLVEPCEVQGTRISVRASIGIALAPRDGQDIDTLLNHADLALYAAKSAGRGEYRFFAPEMAAQTRRRLAVEQALREALDRGELSLAYQPQVDLEDGRVTGFEALLRWQHPVLGAVSPAEFVPVAEDAGLIAPIGRWVLSEACRQAARWPGGLTVAVNVSAVQAMSTDLRAMALDAVAASGIAPQRLELEITESIFLQETRTTLQVLHELRRAGLRIALDDFGTGYSSLAYLRRFPFDTLKIDSTFVRELLQRRDARAIVRMIIGLADTLHMKTVAEGVEQVEQAGLLRHHRCGAMQGYLVARPMPAAEVLPFLQRWTPQAGTSLPPPMPSSAAPLETVM